MTAPHQIIDNFLPDPDSYRAKALTLKYSTVEGPDGEQYKNVFVCPPSEHKEIVEAALGKSIVPECSFLRYAQYGVPTNNLIHADSVYSKYALVLYLNPDDQIAPGSGTAFYQHKKLKYEKLPSISEIKSAGKSPKRVWEILEASWGDVDAWKETGRVEMKYNRAAVYPTDYFHARLPHDSFGISFEESRLIFVSFFNVV